MSDSWGSDSGWATGGSSTTTETTVNSDAGGGGWSSGGGDTADGGGSWGDSAGGSDSRGSGRSGGDRPRGKGCFKCGEEGHMSRECPNPSSGGGGGGGSRGCFKCGEEGHMSRECPNPGSGGGSRSKGCFKCGEEGHMSRDCTNPSNGGGGFGDSEGDGFGNSGLDGEEKPRAPIYRPPDLDINEENFYDTIPAGENFERYDSIPCHVSGDDAPKDPDRYETFGEAFTSETILNGIKQTGFTKPTPIQKYGMRIVMADRDLMACAQTGSGKTLAFILPILQDLFKDKNLNDGYGSTLQEPRAVVVTPTRELAIQIYREAYKFSAGSIVKCQIVYGGTSVGHQRAKLSEGCHVLIGTPGRLIDFMNREVFNFSKLKYFVLDEADRMIDQGFIPDIRKMVSHATMPPAGKRQTLMFSATFPDEVQRVAVEFLAPNYLFLTVGILGAANSDVDQELIKIEKKDKTKKIIDILNSNADNERTMVFVEAKKTADFLASRLSQSGLKATSIHGDRYQSQREEALRDLKSGKYPILVATSVAARGLDIKDVRHVINYDLPKEIDDYIHRIGRTGRLGNKGRAISFYDPNFDRPLAEKLIPVIEKASQSVPQWLKDEAGGGCSDYSNGDFGGLDIRNMNISSSFGDGSASTGEDESWD